MEAPQYSDANEVMTNESNNHLAVNLSTKFEQVKEVKTAPTIFSTAPNRYN